MELGQTKFHPDRHFGLWKVCTCISLKILGSCKENVPHFSGHSICLLVFRHHVYVLITLKMTEKSYHIQMLLKCRLKYI